MTQPIAADAGPLIGLARAGVLELLPELYRTVEIPPAVEDELKLAEERPGSRALRAAQAAGWLVTRALQDPERLADLEAIVDRGEAEAILLAEERSSRFLLLDERRGRVLARKRGIAVAGTGALLLTAKQRGLLPHVADALDRLTAAGYRLSPRLRTELLRRAGE
jgi:uncharacterized protein